MDENLSKKVLYKIRAPLGTGTVSAKVYTHILLSGLPVNTQTHVDLLLNHVHGDNMDNPLSG